MHLLDLIDVYHISDIVVAINGEIQGATFQTILDAQEKGVEVTRMPILYEEMTGRVPIHHLESGLDHPLICGWLACKRLL